LEEYDNLSVDTKNFRVQKIYQNSFFSGKPSFWFFHQGFKKIAALQAACPLLSTYAKLQRLHFFLSSFLEKEAISEKKLVPLSMA